MLRHADSFATSLTQASFERSYTVTAYSHVVLGSPDEFGGKCLRVNNGVCTFERRFDTAFNLSIVGFGFKCVDPLFGTAIAKIKKNTTVILTIKCEYAREPDPETGEAWFRIGFYDNQDTKVAESESFFLQNVKHHFEFFLFPSSSPNGILQFRANEFLDVGLFGLDTMYGTGLTDWNRIEMSLAGDTILVGWMEMSNLTICDGLHPEYGQSNFLGKVVVASHIVDGDSTHNQFVPLADKSRGAPLMILIGTTNGDGKGNPVDLPPPLTGSISNIQIWNRTLNQFQNIQAGVNNSYRAPAYGGTDTVFGPEMNLLYYFQAIHGGAYPVYCIKLCVPEAFLARELDINGWDPVLAGKLYDQLIGQFLLAYTALSNSVYVRGIFWCQGENDARDQHAAQSYKSSLKALVTKLRAAIVTVAQDPEITPFVIADLHQAFVDDDASFRHADQIKTAHRELATELPRCIVVGTDSLGVKVSDTKLYSDVGLLDLGFLMFYHWLAIAPHYTTVDDARLGVADDDSSGVLVDLANAPKVEAYSHGSAGRLGNGEILGAMLELDASLDVAGSGTLGVVIIDPARNSNPVSSTSISSMALNGTTWVRKQLALPYDTTSGRQFVPEDLTRKYIGFGIS